MDFLYNYLIMYTTTYMHAFSFNDKNKIDRKTLNNKSKNGHETNENLTKKIIEPLPKKKGNTFSNKSIYGGETFDKTITYVKKIGEK